MFQFAWPWMFLFLPLPWLIYRFFSPAKTAQTAVLKAPLFEQLQALNTQAVGRSSYLPWFWVIASAVMWVCLVAALARPQWLGEPVPLARAGRDIMLGIDVSGSMEAADLTEKNTRLSRLDVVKQVASAFVQKRVGDRVGLILFGSRAYLQTPLTFDRQTLIEQLNDASVGLAGSRTAMGDAIGLAAKRLQNQKAKERVLILLTDGVNNDGTVLPVDAAHLAKRFGIRIYTIGIGAERVRVNTFWGQQIVNASNSLDEKTLKAIADATNGLYFRARDEAGLQKIYQSINKLIPVKSDKAVFQPIYPLYPWPLALAFIVSLLMLSRRIVQRIRMFNFYLNAGEIS